MATSSKALSKRLLPAQTNIETLLVVTNLPIDIILLNTWNSLAVNGGEIKS
jgi:hypothetical protein